MQSSYELTAVQLSKLCFDIYSVLKTEGDREWLDKKAIKASDIRVLYLSEDGRINAAVPSTTSQMDKALNFMITGGSVVKCSKLGIPNFQRGKNAVTEPYESDEDDDDDDDGVNESDGGEEETPIGAVDENEPRSAAVTVDGADRFKEKAQRIDKFWHDQVSNMDKACVSFYGSSAILRSR